MTTNNAIVAMLRKPNQYDWKIRLLELKELVRSAGYNIVDEVIQTKPAPISSTLFGRGKIDEIKNRAEINNADTLVIWNTLKSIQKFNLERFTGLRVIDRYELVLEIFQRNAGDQLAKMQIELAYLEKLIPYFKLRERLIHGPTDKPFFRAGGEYGWVPKVAWLRKRRKRIKEQIQSMLQKKIVQIKKRKELGFRIVTFVGYYNAGKTSLFNALTGEQKPVSLRPFTTLSPKYSKLRGAEKILLVDTIGFVSDLDPRIISSFRINLEDMVEADMLIWTIDIADNQSMLDLKIKATAKILKRNNLIDKNMLVAANKIDALNNGIPQKIDKIQQLIRKYSGKELEIIPCSAMSGIGLEDLLKETINIFSKKETTD